MNDSLAAKIANEECFHREFRERKEILACRPVQLEFETSSRCNLRCFTCPKTYGNDKGADAPTAIFERLAAATFATARSISLTGFGEPMISPYFEAFFQKSLDAGVAVGFVTNGSFFTEEWLERFAHSETHVFLSVDAADAEHMKRMRPQLDFSKMQRHLQYWRLLKNREGNLIGHLCFNFVLTLRNAGQLPAVVELAAEVGADRVEVLNFQTDGLSETARSEHPMNKPDDAARFIDLARKRAAELGLPLLLPPGYTESDISTEISDFVVGSDAPVEINPPGSKYPLACSAPWFRLSVNLHGDIRPCCWYPFSFGNIMREDFESIWNSVPYRRMRRRINSRFPHLKCKECPLVWGIAAGRPDIVFSREGAVDKLHTFLQRTRHRLSL